MFHTPLFSTSYTVLCVGAKGLARALSNTVQKEWKGMWGFDQSPSVAVEGVQPELGALEHVAVNGTEFTPGYSQPLHKELMQNTVG